jgi:murein DD-endopeptidase MepM/ murein hydrolase activator NlpD
MTQTNSPDNAVLTEILKELKKLNKTSKGTKDATETASISSRWQATGLLALGTIAMLAYQAVFVEAPRSLFGGSNTDGGDLISQGDVIRGYTVTSGFGERTAPDGSKGKGSSFHQGIDLGTPTGVPLYAMGKTIVSCQNDPNGYGVFAEIKAVEVGVEFLAGHLSACNAGTYEDGTWFAMTGDTGNGTAPHLHWGQLKDGKFVQPQTGMDSLWETSGSNGSNG